MSEAVKCDCGTTDTIHWNYCAVSQAETQAYLESIGRVEIGDDEKHYIGAWLTDEHIAALKAGKVLKWFDGEAIQTVRHADYKG